MAIEETARFRHVFEVVDRASPELDKMARSGDKAENSVQRLTRQFTSLKRAAVTALGVISFRRFLDDTAESFHMLDRLRLAMGATIEQADSMADTFADAGVEMEVLNSAVRRWGIQVGQIQKYQREGRKLPVELMQWVKLGKGSLTEFPEALALISERMRGITNETERFTYASMFWGRMTQRLMPLMEKGPEGIRAAMEGPFSGPFNKERFNQAFRLRQLIVQLDRRWLHIKVKLGTAIMPFLEKLADNVMPKIENLMSGVESTFASVSKHADDILETLGMMMKYWVAMKGLAMLRTGVGMFRGRFGGGGGPSFRGPHPGPTRVKGDKGDYLVPMWLAGGGIAGALKSRSGKFTNVSGPRMVLETLLGGKGAGLGVTLAAAAAYSSTRGVFRDFVGMKRGLHTAAGLKSGELVRGPGGELMTREEEFRLWKEKRDRAAELTQADERLVEAEKDATDAAHRMEPALRAIEQLAETSRDALDRFGIAIEDVSRAAAGGVGGIGRLGEFLTVARIGTDREAMKNMSVQINALRRMVEAKRLIERGSAAGIGLETTERGVTFKEHLNRFFMRKYYTGLRGTDDMPGVRVAPAGGTAPNLLAVITLGQRQKMQKELQELLQELGLASKKVTNFNGPIYVDIDARDQDPDRIMIDAFEELSNMSERPITTNMVDPFLQAR